MKILFSKIGNLLFQLQANAPSTTAVAPVINDRMALVALLLEYFVDRNFLISKDEDKTSFKDVTDDWRSYIPESTRDDIQFFILCRDQLFSVTAKIQERDDVIYVVIVVSNQLPCNEYICMCD